MAFSTSQADFSGESPPMSEINVTPLVDVMLVLLIIFMITAPLITHKIAIDLPQASATKNPDKPDIVALAVDADGNLYWNDQAITAEEFRIRVRSSALKTPQPEMQIRAEKTTEYQRLAEIMADAQAAGLVRIGFVTQPSDRGVPQPGPAP